MAGSIPEMTLAPGSRAMPLLALGTASYPHDPPAVKEVVLHAIRLGYRHFDTAALYLSERHLGEAIAQATRLGLLSSRADVFVTSKLWCSDAHRELVLPALRTTLE